MRIHLRKTSFHAMRTIKPLRGKVLIAPAPRQSLKLHGIFLPEAYADPSAHDQYCVLAVGPGRRNRTGVLIEP